MAPPTPPDRCATGPDVVAAGAVVTRKGPRGARCCWCTARSTTTGPSPRASSTPASTSPRPRSARCSRRPVSTSGSARRCAAQQYAVERRTRQDVHYWVGRVVGDDDVSTYRPNDEVDDLGWVRADEAAERLTYADDIETLDAVPRAPQEDLPPGRPAARQGGQAQRLERRRPKRPLTDDGGEQAETVVPLLRAYGVTRVVSSSSTRCWRPSARTPTWHVLDVEVTDELSEEDVRRPGRRGAACHRAGPPQSRPCSAPTGRCSPRSSSARGDRGPARPGRAGRGPPPQGRVVAVEQHQVL